MAYIEFSVEGYKCYNVENDFLFSANETHDTLFDYIFADLSALPDIFVQYISKRIDLNTLNLRDGQGGKDEIGKIEKILEAAHPYYKCESKKVIINAIGNFFNELLLYLCYKKKIVNTDFSKEWYYERILVLLSPLLTIGDEYAADFYHEYQKKIAGEIYLADFDASEMEQVIFDVPSEMPIGFYNEMNMQRNIANMLYFILDIDVPELADLKTPQRTWIYENMFYTSIPSIPSVPKKLSFFPEIYSYHKKFESGGEDVIGLKNTFRALEKFRGDPISCYGISAEMMKFLLPAIDLAKSEWNKQLREIYEIESLYQLLTLEIMLMIQSGLKVRKCKNCGKYFIVPNKKVVYCNRMDESGESCCDLGPQRSFQKKLDKDEALRIYTRAYRTHYARVDRSTMSEEEFNIWKNEAKEKLLQVREGELTISEFQAWLKK